MSKRLSLKALLAGAALAALPAGAAPLVSFNLVVERVGTGAAALTSAGTPVFLDEFKKTGTLVQSIALPTSAGGGNNMLVESGTATSAGLITRSGDGKLILVPGYNAAPGTAGVSGSAPGTINRTLGVVKADGTVDTSNLQSNGPSANFRGITSQDGTQFWTSTQGGASAAGIFNVAAGNATGTSILNGNTRGVAIYGGQLFVSSNNATPGIGVSAVGTGLPTTSATVTGTIPIASGSPFQFVFMDLTAESYLGTGLDTLYVADDRNNGSGGGLLKFTFDGSSWTLQYTLTAGLPTGAAGGLRGLAGEVISGQPVLYATNAGSSSQNSLFAVTDTSAGATFTKLADSPNNTLFRGVALGPVSNSVALTAGGGADLGANLRGAVMTAGASGSYVGTVFENPGAGLNWGYIDVNGSLPTPSTDAPIFVLLDLAGVGDLGAFAASLLTGAGSPAFMPAVAGDADFDELAAAYAGPGRSWDLLLKFPTLPAGATAGNLDFAWNFSAAPGVSVERMVVVPEPGSVALLGLAATALLRRRGQRPAARSE